VPFTRIENFTVEIQKRIQSLHFFPKQHLCNK